MKRLLTIIAVTLGFAALAVAADWNPHAGLNHLFISKWNHRDPAIVRYEMPQSILDTYRTIQYANATDGNLDRPVAMHQIPVLLNARKPLDKNSWRFVEDWRIEAQPQQDGRLKYNMLFNGTDVDQWRWHLPALDSNGVPNGPGTYAIFLHFDHAAKAIHFGEGMTQLNTITLGNKKIQVHGDGTINLGAFAILEGRGLGPCLYAQNQLTMEKNGKRYLKIAVEGTKPNKWGIPLEQLEW